MFSGRLLNEPLHNGIIGVKERLFMEMPTVAFMTFDWTHGAKTLEPNGCAWYRCMLPMFELRKHGWDAGIGMPGWNDKHGFGMLLPDKGAIHGWDILVLKLIMLKSVADKIDEAKAMGQKIVVDIDDWFDGLEKSNMAYQITDPTHNPVSNREHYRTIIDKADALITSTPFLYDYYSKTHDNVFMVRNGIDAARWFKKNDHVGSMPTVGWVGATPWRSKDLELMRTKGFGAWLDRNRLAWHHSGHVTGSAEAWKQAGVYETTKHTQQGMAPISQYPNLFKKIDIGIVPLSDVGFNHAKSYIKGLEYAAAGVPFVASNLPEYQLLADAGVGRVADSAKEWQENLSLLIDPKQRKEDRERNLAGIEQFSMDVTGLEWDRVMREILAQ